MPKYPNFSEGLAACFKIGLLFLVGFLLLRQSVILSLILATLGGLSGAWILTGWQDTTPPNFSQEGNSKIQPENQVVPAGKNWQSPTKQRRQRRSSWFFWKNPRSSKSRRS